MTPTEPVRCRAHEEALDVARVDGVWQTVHAATSTACRGTPPSAVARVRAWCAERLEQQLAEGPLSPGYDLDIYRAGEIEGWRTCLRVLDDLPADRTPAQAVFTLAGFRTDHATEPKHRTWYDRERGNLSSTDAQAWSLAWNRVVSRVQGWLEAEFGPAEYEDIKDLPRPPLTYIDWSDPDRQKDLQQAVDATLGRRTGP